MTTDQPQPTPGQHVWVESVALSDGCLALVHPRSGEVGAEHFDPNAVRWRSVPDDTAAEASTTLTIVRRERDILLALWERIASVLGADGEDATDEGVIAAAEALVKADRVHREVFYRPAEPLAAGVPVGSQDSEPGPGAYLIGDLLAVRWPGDIGAAHWCVQATGMIDGYGNRSWNNIRRDFADKPMRRLLPRTQPTEPESVGDAKEIGRLRFLLDKLRKGMTDLGLPVALLPEARLIRVALEHLAAGYTPGMATLEVEGEPLTLDAIRDVVREVQNEPIGDDNDAWFRREISRGTARGLGKKLADFLPAIGDVFDNRLEAFIEKYDRDLSEAREERDETRRLLESETIRANGNADEIARAWKQRDEAREEREEALQDIARYDTGLAKLADALHAAGIHIGADVATVAAQALGSLAAERNEARRERDEALAIVGGQNLELHAKIAKLRKGMRVLLDPDEAQEPAQTPGGDA